MHDGLARVSLQHMQGRLRNVSSLGTHSPQKRPDETIDHTIGTSKDDILREGALVSDEDTDTLRIDMIGGNSCTLQARYLPLLQPKTAGLGKYRGGRRQRDIVRNAAPSSSMHKDGSVTGEMYGICINAAGMVITKDGTVAAALDAYANDDAPLVENLFLANSGTMRGGADAVDLGLVFHEITNDGLRQRQTAAPAKTFCSQRAGATA